MLVYFLLAEPHVLALVLILNPTICIPTFSGEAYQGNAGGIHMGTHRQLGPFPPKCVWFQNQP